MLNFCSVFITSCKLLTALICLVTDVPRLDCDRMSHLIEIKNVLLDILENNEKASIVGSQIAGYIS